MVLSMEVFDKNAVQKAPQYGDILCFECLPILVYSLFISYHRFRGVKGFVGFKIFLYQKTTWSQYNLPTEM